MRFFKLLMAVAALLTIFSGCEKKQLAQTGNDSKLPIAIEAGKAECAQCKMTIAQARYSAQVTTPNGVTNFFDDIGCLIHWFDSYGGDKNALALWVYSEDTKKFVDARKAYYNEGEATPMGYGFAAYEIKKDGLFDFEAMKKKSSSNPNGSK